MPDMQDSSTVDRILDYRNDIDDVDYLIALAECQNAAVYGLTATVLA